MTLLTASHKKDIATILASNQFDAHFYLENYPEVEHSGLAPLVHYVMFGCKEHKNPNETFNTDIYKTLFSKVMEKQENPFAHYLRNHENTAFFEKGLLQNYTHGTLTKCLKKLKHYPFFKEDHYKALHKNINFSTISPTRHALLHGIGEGRDILSPPHIAQFFGLQCQKKTLYKARSYTHTAHLPSSVGVFYHTDGNTFIKELAQNLCAYLQQSGLNTQPLTEKTPLSQTPELCIFCAPHEFFFLEGSEHWKQETILTRSIMFNTEQPHTLWFTRGLLYCLMSAGIMDLCLQNLPAFLGFDVPLFHFDPLPKLQKAPLTRTDKNHSFYRILPPRAQKLSSPFTKFAQRPLDISFFGNSSAKRERFFVQNANFFAAYNCFLYYRKTDGPLSTQGQHGALLRLPRHIAEQSKIFLNIHRDDMHFFEWHRIVAQGMASGAVVVTEECFPHPLYKAGTHYLTETARHIPNLLEWLLTTPDGQNKAEALHTSTLTLLQNRNLMHAKTQDLTHFISSVWAQQS